MPYATIADLPQAVRDQYSDRCQHAFMEAFNGCDGDESQCFAVAHIAAQNCQKAGGLVAIVPEWGAERKVFPLVDAAISDVGELSGYANVTGIVDDGGDKVLPGAYANGVLDRFLHEGFMSWSHNWDVPVAYPVEAREDAKGLFTRYQFHSTPAAQEARTIASERLAAGKSVGLSIGYEVGKATPTSYGRDIHSFNRLFEVGMVMVPMNGQSTVSAVKGVLGSGLPYAERLGLVLAEAEALVAHSRERAELRQKEGRVLSTDNRKRLATLKESLSAVLTDIDDLLRATDPDREKAAARAAFARAVATLNGVSLN